MAIILHNFWGPGIDCRIMAFGYPKPPQGVAFWDLLPDDTWILGVRSPQK